MSRLLLILILFLVLTQTASASVVISEVAWMGSSVSANHEWIELYNSGQDGIDVSGWVLNDGMNLNIPLSGQIPALTYVVLERTSDDSAPGTAFLIYSGALVNTGATLVLRDSSGTIKDQVAGGENWQNIGGDNATKETAQYSSQGWVTDVATPGQVNRTGREETPLPVVSGTTSSPVPKSNSVSGSGKKSVTESVRLQNSAAKMIITPELQNVAYVNQLVPFKVNLSGINDDKNKLVRYEWNFGDTHATSGKEVKHIYKYPGQYLVTVKAVYKKEEQISQKEITVLPVTFSLARNEAGDIQIHNNANYAVDISGYKLKGDQTITLPPQSVILGKATITIAKQRIAKNNLSLILLFDAENSLVASTNESANVHLAAVSDQEVVPLATIAAGIIESVPAGLSGSEDFNFASETNVIDSSDVYQVPEETADLEEESMVPSKNNEWPYFALILLILISVSVIIWSANQRHLQDDLEKL